ncbi:GNAT family N-acetyltransferase [Neolewinella antarctica]|uniref:Ribosomal protein S18 acetylase RimI-like enzyme n=1 Tax=Neolewinella antarctica TaxID=442734 RepID=A0ABX0XD40_9BACT|nr:GNAT family N-acetyltransferase [Neolewinella antarctica]NJC27218.1 ribosomal protein S18 acetylase RimI-like enzyme [Neolewinella antarctica]
MYYDPDEIRITLARKKTELRQIIELQRANLKTSVGAEVAETQGFLSAVHDYDVLEDMNNNTAAVIAKKGTKVVGYALAMLRPYAAKIPTLTPVWALQDGSEMNGELLGGVNYLGMGQVCVAEEARGQKVVDRMYKYMRSCYSLHYPYLITSIDVNNTRSRRVHERIGFKELSIQTATTGQEWVVVGWDWVRRE